MALCRWSECDLYIYESTAGIMCHVARSRYTDGAAGKILDGRDLVPGDLVSIGLPHDGESRVFDDYGDLLEYVEKLKALGYDVPDWVIEDIREEAAEEPAEG